MRFEICKAENITIMDFWVVRSYVWGRNDSCMWNPRPSESDLVSTTCRIIMKFDKELFTKVFENGKVSWTSAHDSHILLRK
jgi:hypothetical protein